MPSIRLRNLGNSPIIARASRSKTQTFIERIIKGGAITTALVEFNASTNSIGEPNSGVQVFLVDRTSSLHAEANKHDNREGRLFRRRCSSLPLHGLRKPLAALTARQQRRQGKVGRHLRKKRFNPGKNAKRRRRRFSSRSELFVLPALLKNHVVTKQESGGVKTDCALKGSGDNDASKNDQDHELNSESLAKNHADDPLVPLLTSHERSLWELCNSNISAFAQTKDGSYKINRVMTSHPDHIDRIFNECLNDLPRLISNPHAKHVCMSLAALISEQQLETFASRITTEDLISNCRDKHGSHTIFVLLNRACTVNAITAIDTIGNALWGHIVQLFTHSCGNYVIQALLERWKHPSNQLIYDKLGTHFKEVAFDKYGNHVVQCAMKAATPEQLESLMRLVRDHALELARSENGCFVVLAASGYKDAPVDSICNNLSSDIFNLSAHKITTFVIQKYLKHGSQKSKSLFIEKLLSDPRQLKDLLFNRYGGYFVQIAMMVSKGSSSFDSFLKIVTEALPELQDARKRMALERRLVRELWELVQSSISTVSSTITPISSTYPITSTPFAQHSPSSTSSAPYQVPPQSTTDHQDPSPAPHSQTLSTPLPLLSSLSYVPQIHTSHTSSQSLVYHQGPSFPSYPQTINTLTPMPSVNYVHHPPWASTPFPSYYQTPWCPTSVAPVHYVLPSDACMHHASNNGVAYFQPPPLLVPLLPTPVSYDSLPMATYPPPSTFLGQLLQGDSSPTLS